jgi:hypothetical protein
MRVNVQMPALQAFSEGFTELSSAVNGYQGLAGEISRSARTVSVYSY